LEGLEARYDETLRGSPCSVCHGVQDEDAMVICDRCEAVFHPSCGADGGRNPVHDGPWYCAVCRGHIHLNGFRDSVEDIGLIDYLWLGRVPDDEGEAERVQR
jgi:PHD-finger